MNQRVYLEMESEISFWKRHADSLAQEIEIHKARVKKLTKALEFYSDPRFYRPDGAVDVQPDMADNGNFTWKLDTGEMARKALEELGL